jgi:hypothetical protein
MGGTSGSIAGEGHDKLYVCHRTASETNPYVLIHVPNPAQLQAHLNGTAKGHFPTRVGDDYVPTQYEIDNGCGTKPEPKPTPTPEPTPEPTPTPEPEPKPVPKVTMPEPRVSVRSCGDPRLLVTLSNYGTGTIRYTITVTTQNKGRVTLVRRVGPNSTKVLAPVWYKGGTKVVIRANGKVIVKRSYKTRGWGKGSCPASLRAARADARNR